MNQAERAGQTAGNALGRAVGYTVKFIIQLLPILLGAGIIGAIFAFVAVVLGQSVWPWAIVGFLIALVILIMLGWRELFRRQPREQE